MNMEETRPEAPEAPAYEVQQAHVDQLTALTFAMSAAQVYLKAMHPSNRRAFLKEPNHLLGIVFLQFATQIAGSEDGAKALMAEMKQRGF